MNVTRRTTAAVGLVAVGALAMAGCSGGADDAGGGVTLNYFTWNNEANMQPIIDAFEEAHPGITIELSSANNNPQEYGETLLTRASGNQLPDVFHLSLETTAELVDAGMVYDLSGADALDGATIDPYFTRGDAVYGMSLSAWAGVIIYNVDLLKSVGYDSVPTDLDGFIELGEALNEAGIEPYLEDLSGPSGSFTPMLGGWYAAQGTTDAGVIDGTESFDTWVPVIEQWQKMVGTVMPKEVVGVSGDQIKQNFMAGQLAMYRSGAWDFPDLESAGVNFSTAPMPAVEGGEPYIGGGADSPYALSAALEGDKLEASLEFLQFLNSAEGLELAEENLGQVSTSTNFDATVDPAIADVYKDYIQQGKFYWTQFPHDGAVMGAALSAQFQLLVQGEATPEDVAAALDAAWKK